MDLYPLLIFVHVLGAVGLFAAIGIEVLAFTRLQRAASVGQAQTWMALLRDQGRIGPVSMVAILVTGIWMLVVRWGPEPWMIITLAWLIAMGVSTALLARRPMARLGALLTDDTDSVAPDFPAAVTSTPLAASLRLRVFMAVGIVALMTIKPGLAGSLAIVGAAVALGLATAVLPTRRKAPATT